MDEHMNAMARDFAESSGTDTAARLIAALTPEHKVSYYEQKRRLDELLVFTMCDRYARDHCLRSPNLAAFATANAARHMVDLGTAPAADLLNSLRDDYAIVCVLAHIETRAGVARSQGVHVPAVTRPANGDSELALIAELGGHSQPLYDALLTELTRARGLSGSGKGERPLRDWYDQRPHLLEPAQRRATGKPSTRPRRRIGLLFGEGEQDAR